MVGWHKGFVHAKFVTVPTRTRQTTPPAIVETPTLPTRHLTPPGIAKQWPTLLLIKLGRITMHRFTEALKPFGIRPRHVAALIELRGQLTQQALCGQLHVDPTNLVEILNDLEERGYATRRRDPEDRRRHIVEVSKKGIAVIDKVAQVMDGVQDSLLDGFEPAERAELGALLTSVWEISGGYEAWSQAAEADEKG
jgi:DNA-binding MarR family transcriptional regulator